MSDTWTTRHWPPKDEREKEQQWLRQATNVSRGTVSRDVVQAHLRIALEKLAECGIVLRAAPGTSEHNR